MAGGSKDKAREEYAALLRAHPDSAAPFNRLVNLYQA